MAVAPCRASPLRMEERKVGPRVRVPFTKQTRLLGAQRISSLCGPVERAKIHERLNSVQTVDPKAWRARPQLIS